MRLVFVCTGNMCRSPLAAGLTEAWVNRSADPEARLLDVRSAGTKAPAGEPMDRFSADALARLGGDPVGRTAMPLMADLAADADLVLTMTRRHRKAVLELSPRGLRRTFTLLEAADLIQRVEVRDLARLPLDDRARELGLRLDTARAHRVASDADDIEDPIGRRQPVHDAVADTIARALRPLLSALFPAPAHRTAASRPGGLPIGA